MKDLGNHYAGRRIWVVLGEADVDDQITIVGLVEIDLKTILEIEETNKYQWGLPSIQICHLPSFQSCKTPLSS